MLKRGVSGVVATVLGVLIVMAGTFVLWNSTEEIVRKDFSFSGGSVEIDSSSGYTGYDAEKGLVSVRVVRGKGEMDSFDVFFYREGRTLKINTNEKNLELPDEGEAKVYYFDVSDLGGEPDSVKVVPVYSAKSLEEGEGSETSDLPTATLSFNEEVVRVVDSEKKKPVFNTMFFNRMSYGGFHDMPSNEETGMKNAIMLYKEGIFEGTYPVYDTSKYDHEKLINNAKKAVEQNAILIYDDEAFWHDRHENYPDLSDDEISDILAEKRYKSIKAIHDAVPDVKVGIYTNIPTSDSDYFGKGDYKDLLAQEVDFYAPEIYFKPCWNDWNNVEDIKNHMVEKMIEPLSKKAYNKPIYPVVWWNLQCHSGYCGSGVCGGDNYECCWDLYGAENQLAPLELWEWLMDTLGKNDFVDGLIMWGGFGVDVRESDDPTNYPMWDERLFIELGEKQYFDSWEILTTEDGRKGEIRRGIWSSGYRTVSTTDGFKVGDVVTGSKRGKTGIITGREVLNEVYFPWDGEEYSKRFLAVRRNFGLS